MSARPASRAARATTRPTPPRRRQPSATPGTARPAPRRGNHVLAGADGHERRLVRLRQDELVVALVRIFGVEEVVVAELARREAVERLAVADGLGQRGD